ncbi:hypothetical protein HYU16_01300 [Candidatus Woesearchaeota archaeon]|nr:hypothetical protein [Candidatus Woesearchaeota archaeon]
MWGYELIGAWKVSRLLPKEARDGLKAYFAALKSRDVPIQIVLSDHHFLNKAQEALAAGNTVKQSLEQCIESVAERLIPGVSESPERRSFLEHSLISSSWAIPENPFVPFENLYGGQEFPVVDYKATQPIGVDSKPVAGTSVTRQDGIVVFPNGNAWWWMGYRPYLFERWQKSGFPVPSHIIEDEKAGKVKTYKFQVVMDWKKREAKIEPLPAEKPMV